VRRITYLLCLVLIFMMPWEDSVSTLGLGSLTRVAWFVVAAFWFATILLDGRFRKPQVFHLAVLIFFLWNLTSVYWSRDIGKTLQRVQTYAQILLLMLVLWEMLRTAGQLDAGLQAYVLGGYVLVVGTIYDYIRGIVAVSYEVRYSAPGVNAVDLALILLLGLPVALHLALGGTSARKSRILTLINVAYIPLAIFSVILTASRTSLIAILPFGLYLAASQRIRLQRKIAILVGLLFALGILLPMVPEAVISRLSTVGASIGQQDIGGRVQLWQEAITELADHPILGIGSGTLAASIGSAAHDTFISVAAETGFVGLTIFLSILTIAIYQAVQLPRETAGLWLAVIFTWAIGVLSLSWEFRKPTWLFLSLVIIAGAFSAEVQARATAPADSRPTRQALEMPEAGINSKVA
jgi:putative inorganic carbon (HCO3(-)) transporter